MKHDLDAINAAWMLGDRFALPRGTECRLTYHHDSTSLVKSGMYYLDYAVVAYYIVIKEYILCPSYAYPNFGLYRGALLRSKVPLFCERFHSILSIPDGAPPFGEWERI
jgi:hypothetical protein